MGARIKARRSFGITPRLLRSGSANLAFTRRIRCSICRASVFPPPPLSYKPRQGWVYYSHGKIRGFPIRLRPRLGHNNCRGQTKAESRPSPLGFRKPEAKGKSCLH